MKVCKCGGRVFVVLNATGDCEFEGDSGHIEKYPDSNTTSATLDACITPSPTSNNGKDSVVVILSVFGGVGLVVLLGWITHFCLKRRNKRQSREPTDEPAETVALRDVRTAGENGEREAAGGPGLDDACIHNIQA
ncbi:uncharacterized protein LOC144539642 [Centroberyx gerrardi]